MVLIGQTLQAHKGLTTEHLLRFTRLLGFELCEINPAGTSLENVDKLIPLVGDMPLTFHLPIEGIENFEFAQPNKKDEIKSIIKLINNNKDDLNLILGVFHPPEAENGNLKTLVENLSQLDIKLIVENVPDYTDNEFLEIYNTLKDHLGVQLKGWLFDVAHSYLVNGPSNFMEILNILPYEELEEIHLSDCLEDRDAHYAFGAGVLPINEILREIKDREFDRIIVNEIDAYPSIWSVIDSYRMVAKLFKKSLYRKVTFRYRLVKPLIQKKLSKAGIS